MKPPTGLAPRIFSSVARVYDLPMLQSLAYRPNHDLVMAELRRVSAASIVDVGCGTGILTARIQNELHPSRLVGCDASDGMLAKARARDVQGVEWVRSFAETLPFEDGTVDAIVSTEAFHFFDQPAALAEFARILRPGGTVIVVSVLTVRPLMRRMVAGAGLELIEQRVARRLPGLPASVATVARRPEEA